MAGTVLADTLQDGSGNSTTMTNAIQGSAKAWVRYDSANKVVRASYNVSSVTYNATGQWNLNFINAMPDTNYSFVGTGSFNDGVVQNMLFLIGGYRGTSITSSTLPLQGCYVSGGSFVSADGYVVNVAVFR